MMKKVLLAFGALLLLGVLIITVVARSTYFQERLQRIVLQEIQTRTGLSIDAKKIQFALFPPAISIELATFKIPQILDAQIPKALIRLSTPALIRGSIVIRSLELRKPRFTLLAGTQLEEGGELPPFPAAEPSTLLFSSIQDIPIQMLKIRDGDIEWPLQNFKGHIVSLLAKKRRGEVTLNTSLQKLSFFVNGNEIPIDTFQFIGATKEHRATIRSLQARSSWGTLNANGIIWGGLFEGKEKLLQSEIDLSLRGDVQLTHLKEILRWKEHTKGVINFRSSVSGKIGQPQFSGQLEGKEVGINDITIPNFNANISGDRKAIDIKPLLLTLNDRKLSITGTLHPFNQWGFEGVAELNQIFLMDVLESLGVTSNPVRAEVSGAITAKGNFLPVNLSYSASLEVRGFEAGSEATITHFPLGKVETRGIVNEQKITFDHGQVLIDQGGSISTSGFINYTGPIRFDFFAEQFNLDSLSDVAGLEIKGLTSIVGSVTDAPGQPTVVQGTVRAEEFSFAKVDIGWFRGVLNYAKDILNVSQTTVRQGESEYQFRGDINVSTGAFIKSQFLFTKLRYQDLRQTIAHYLPLPEWIEGEFKGRGALDGTITEEGISAKVDVAMSDAKILGEPFKAVRLIGRIDQGNLSIQRAILQKPKGRFLLSGGAVLGKSVNLELTSAEADYEDLDILKRNKVPLDGIIDVHGTLTGPWSNPIGDGLITISQVSLAGEPLPASTITFNLREKLLAIKWALENRQMLLNSTIHFENSYPFTLSFSADRYHFDPFLSLIASTDATLKGEMQGIADLRGTLKPLAFKEGRATFQKLIIQRGTIVFQNREPIDVRVMEGTLHIQPFHLVGGQTDLLISGSLDPNAELNLQLNGGFDLALLEVFAKPITRASGTARVQARISGTVRNPSLLGNLSLYQAALQTAWLPQPIEQINGDIVFSKQLISIERARGIWGGGPISAQGSISWPENAPVTFSLNMTSRNNRIQLIRGFHTRISSDLHFSGQTRPYLLSGEITIEEAVYKERIDWQTNLFKQKPKYGPKVIREELPLIGLDVAIDASRGIRVDNNLAKMAFQGQLQLVGSIENPNLVGKFDLIYGKTFFQDNEFKLTGGEIEFNDPLEINPYFHLQAESKVRDYLVSVALIGYLGDYEVQLASQPPLSEPDIAALLTLGVTAGEVAGQEGQFAAVELGSLLFGGVSQAIERQIGLPITFRSTPSYSTTKEATVPKVIVGTKITDQIDASFSTTIGESAVFEDKEARIRYKFNDNLSLQGVWEDETQTQQLNDDSKIGVDLNYQFEFK